MNREPVAPCACVQRVPVPVRETATPRQLPATARQERNDKYAKEFQDELIGKLGKIWPFGRKD